jgi:uncharacterized protein YvpB/subtilisin-like proprotein convertase family protein
LIEFIFLIGLLTLFSIFQGTSAYAQAQVNLPQRRVLLEDLATPTQTVVPTATQILTDTLEITPTSTISDTTAISPEPTASPALPAPTPVLTLEPNSTFLVPSDTWQYNYLPYVAVHRIPTTTNLFCSQGNSMNIPDNDPNGIVSNLSIDQPGILIDINIYLKINHAWPGDLKASLLQRGTGIRVDLLDRPGVPASSLGCGNDHIQSILDDNASQPAENKCGAYPVAIGGIFRPSNPLSQFNCQLTADSWDLEISDLALYDTGSLQQWCLEITSADPDAPPAPTPTPVTPPSSANISGVTGQNQALSLDCESRAAVDWARFFGSSIPELEFYNRLPHSDNPEKGFVGNVNGTWGYIPPGDYGVHAEPVAALLRDYGLNARAYHSLRWDDIRFEIAAGRPVIVWVTGPANAGRYPSGAPQYYISASDQNFTVVANYEHTVIVTSYTSSTVTIRDGSSVYSRDLNEFLDSWSSLRNMAIMAHP